MPFWLLLVALGLVAIGFLIRRGERAAGRRRSARRDDGINHDELDAAEREVRDLGIWARPDEEIVGDDWGPGASRPRPPERL